MKLKTSLHIVSALVLGLGAAGAHAAGFNLLEQTASGIGNSYAGSAANPENASTIYFNPAGMSELEGFQLSGGLTAIRPSFKFKNDGSTGPGGVVPLGTNNGGDAGSWGFVPNLYASWQLAPRWHVGLGIGAPFGLKTEYDDDWIGRYHSREFDIKTININPSVAYKVNDQLSIGAGVNYTQLDATYRRAAYMPGTGDLNAKLKADGDGWGWNAGLLYKVTPATRIGLSYRSTVKVNVDGDTKITHDVAGLIAKRDASSTVKLPDTAIFSVAHDLNNKWQLLADVSWTGWSSIKSLDINNGGAPFDDELELKFRDTWRVALGANYRYNERWTLRGGLAWDQSPIRSNQYRPTSLPDNDRYWASIGARYSPNDKLSVDIGYAHLFVKSTRIDNNTDVTKGHVKGKYDAKADLIGVQVSYRF